MRSHFWFVLREKIFVWLILLKILIYFNISFIFIFSFITICITFYIILICYFLVGVVGELYFPKRSVWRKPFSCNEKRKSIDTHKKYIFNLKLKLYSWQKNCSEILSSIFLLMIKTETCKRNAWLQKYRINILPPFPIGTVVVVKGNHNTR